MGATVINALGIILASLLGWAIGKKLKFGKAEVVTQSAGIITIVLGISEAQKSENLIITFVCLILGGAIGFLVNLEEKIEKFGNSLVPAASQGAGTASFGQAFLTASTLFCIGPMAIMGPIAAGGNGDWSVLWIKTALDTVTALALGSTMGLGIAASGVSVLVYQGIFTFFGQNIVELIGQSGVASMCALGGTLLIMIGLGLTEIKKMKTANYLPALFLAMMAPKLLEMFK